jgi:hypothetical protein
MQPIIDDLRAKGLLIEDKGAQIVDLQDYGMPPALILRSDGATLYITRDLAAAKYRKDTYHFDKSLYVVAYQQDLHFRQLFKVLELMGYDWYKDCEHVAFGMVSFGGESLSTRQGRVVYLDDLLHQAIDKARAIIEEKSPELTDKDEVARQVGIGAVVFFDLYNNRIKDIDFTWERALNFDGETGPYVQYTHARACSVLRKAGEGDMANPDFAALADPFSQDDLQADYVGTLDGVLDFAYRDILLEEVHAGRGIKGNQTLRSKIADHFAKYPDDFKLVLFLDNHDTDRFMFDCHDDVNLLQEAIDLTTELPRPFSFLYGTEQLMTNNPTIFNAEPYADLRVRNCMDWSKSPQLSIRKQTV